MTKDLLLLVLVAFFILQHQNQQPRLVCDRQPISYIMTWLNQTNQIPGKHKLLFLAACFLGCLCTFFLPYNSFHLNTASIIIPAPLNKYCRAITAKHKDKCYGKESNTNDECLDLQADVADCVKAVIKAYNEIDLSGCINQIAKYTACSQKYCQGVGSSASSGDVAVTKRRDDESSGDDKDTVRNDGDNCARCEDKAEKLQKCEERILMRWFRRYRIDDDYH